jgi:hypothetical protein
MPALPLPAAGSPVQPPQQQQSSQRPPPALVRAPSPPPVGGPISSRPPPPRKKEGPSPAWDGNFDPGDDVDWQKLWLATQKKSWRSLVVLASGSECETLRVAQALALVGWHHLGKTIKVIDATKLSLGDLETRLSEVASRTARGETVIVALASVVEKPAALALAQAGDAVILCVTLGETKIGNAEKSLKELAREKILGTVIVEPTKPAKPAGAPAK